MNPIEMHDTWPNAVSKLQADPAYEQLFLRAFGTTQIDSMLVAKALAQFMRTMVSSNAKYDRVLRGEEAFTPEEQQGFFLFQAEGVFLLMFPVGRGVPIVSTAIHLVVPCSPTTSCTTMVWTRSSRTWAPVA